MGMKFATPTLLLLTAIFPAKAVADPTSPAALAEPDSFAVQDSPNLRLTLFASVAGNLVGNSCGCDTCTLVQAKNERCEVVTGNLYDDGTAGGEFELPFLKFVRKTLTVRSHPALSLRTTRCPPPL